MSWAMWVTGRPGSGKSTLAQAAAARLSDLGELVTVLELDRIRRVITPSPTYSDREREVVYRSLVFMAVALTTADVPVIIDATAHRRAWRDLARASIGHFAEIQVDCPVELAEAREQTRTPGAAPRGIYAAAARPGARVPGVNVPYERAESPELVVDTGVETVDSAVARIAALRLLWPIERQRRDDGAVIWITGPPGSGKTTLASHLAEALASEQVHAQVLEWAAVKATVLGGHAAAEPDVEIAHRALAYTAKLLADAGVSVIVDATAPRRVWRALARELVNTFAEVQLVCPPEICVSRERSVRWGVRPCPHASDVAPDIVLEYEYSLNPDLVLDTATRSEWTAREDLLRLARRLRRGRLAS
jgi:adenylylsulfate kinase